MINPSIRSFAIAIIAVSALTGCSSSGYKDADKTGEGIAEFRSEIVNGKKAIDNTMKALDQVAVSATTDPRKPFENFSKQVANLEATAAAARKRSQEMKSQGKAYFAKWEKQLADIKNPEIRALAIDRKAKLQETFDRIGALSDPLKSKFDPWMSDLKDLQKVLSNDLTVAGVDAAKDLFGKTQSEGVEVQKSMNALVAELNSVAATITPAKANK